LDIVKPSTLSEIPLWKLIKPRADISLSEIKKSETNSLVFKKLSEIKQSTLSECCHLYRWLRSPKQGCNCCSD
jgi:hypothetical protein